MKSLAWIAIASAAALAAGCASDPGKTLAELHRVEADISDIALDDSLEQAARSYRRYLDETPVNERTPEAMRRLADLQLEQEYGVLGSGGELREMAAPQRGTATPMSKQPQHQGAQYEETVEEFERRASGPIHTDASEVDTALPGMEQIPQRPKEAIATYWTILEQYPRYERNDQVLYQLSRAYDEIGDPDQAMQVMSRLVSEYPHSRFVDEVQFRRGEYFFMRKRYRDAESAYQAVESIGYTSAYYELSLYKLGWALYKQEFYEEALHKYFAMLDHRKDLGLDFDNLEEVDGAVRLEDTFRVISLSFSNLGGPEVLDEYFSAYGQRSYADKVYANLGEFYLGKRRFQDAATVYESFAELHPFHRQSPYFRMRVIEIYMQGDFPQLVVEAKKTFCDRYALSAEYWEHFAIADAPRVVEMLKKNLTDLASHYHALYQDPEESKQKPVHFSSAQHWYQEFLASFSDTEQAPAINYRLADLLLEHGSYVDAARQYERTAYDYGSHKQAAAAGYAAVYAYRQQLELSGDADSELKLSTINSSLRFAETFPGHEQAPPVLGAAADDLYAMNLHEQALQAATTLVTRYPDANTDLRRAGWAVIAHSSMDLQQFPAAEQAYGNVLQLTPGEDDSRNAVIDSLAAAIYKQGELANAEQDYRMAAQHFLRIKQAAPTSTIRSAAEYDAAAALMHLQDWSGAATVLEAFRADHAAHELAPQATRQLAHVYKESGQLEKSAAEHERIAYESDDPELQRVALLTAGEMYDEVGRQSEAMRIYAAYAQAYPEPLDIAMETRTRLAELLYAAGELGAYHGQLQEIVAAYDTASSSRSDRSRYLAARAALVLAMQRFEEFRPLQLVQPFDTSLAKKQAHMDRASAAMEQLLDYGVAEVTAAATYHIAEIYLNFSAALMKSERPTDLDGAELAEYELMLEEEAFPFEERGIEVHEQNFALLRDGISNSWVDRSVARLATLMPGRYAKAEITTDFIGPSGLFAYQPPGAQQPEVPQPDQPVSEIEGRDMSSVSASAEELN